MSADIKSLRAPILVALAIAAGIALLAYLSQKNNQDWGTPSSYCTRQYGGKAAYLLLLQSGYPVQRWTKSPLQLPRKASGVTLVLAGPEQRPTTEQTRALERFVRSGGRVVITGWWISLTTLPNALHRNVLRVGFAKCSPSAPTELTRAGTITQEGALGWGTPQPGQTVHYRDAHGRPVVVSYRLGQGEVIWWASPLPLTNIGIRDRGNLDLLLYSLGKSNRILWDEYFHTDHEAARTGRYALVLRWGEWQALLLGAALLVTYARRSGPVVALQRFSRLSPLEFVQTMGSVFHKADARLAPLEIAFARLRSLAVRRLALPADASAEEIAVAMQRRGFGVTDGLAVELRAAEDALSDPALTEGEAIAHVRTIHQLLAKLEGEKYGKV